MNKSNERFVSPQNVREAMLTIEKLFNQYRHAPLTAELLKYHQNLINRLQDDILREAVRENNPRQLEELEKMTASLQSWMRVRMSNQPFQYKMKHFKLVAESSVKYSRRVIKNHSAGNHRASRH